MIELQGTDMQVLKLALNVAEGSEQETGFESSKDLWISEPSRPLGRSDLRST